MVAHRAILALRRRRQEGGEFEASLGYIVSSSQLELPSKTLFQEKPRATQL
jgi:hypothetical protein